MKNKTKAIAMGSENVFVIMRFDMFHDIDTKMEWRLKAKRVYRVKKEALKERERLNKVNGSKETVYFLKTAKLLKRESSESSTPSYWKSPNPKYEHVFPIIGYDAKYNSNALLEKKIILRKIMRVLEEVQAEIEKLNRSKGKYKYFASCAQLLK